MAETSMANCILSLKEKVQQEAPENRIKYSECFFNIVQSECFKLYKDAEFWKKEEELLSKFYCRATTKDLLFYTGLKDEELDYNKFTTYIYFPVFYDWENCKEEIVVVAGNDEKEQKEISESFEEKRTMIVFDSSRRVCSHLPQRVFTFFYLYYGNVELAIKETKGYFDNLSFKEIKNTENAIEVFEFLFELYIDGK